MLLRRKLESGPAISEHDADGQHLLSFAAVDARKQVWEYGVLFTSLHAEILTLGQAYRDRAIKRELLYDTMRIAIVQT